MVKAAAERGWGRKSAVQIMTGLRSGPGADPIVTYWARELAEWTRR
jgi:delta-aminolevulinic acid dehydratase/porphobilinogen synthase